jgi:hypothetical protein
MPNAGGQKPAAARRHEDRVETYADLVHLSEEGAMPLDYFVVVKTRNVEVAAARRVGARRLLAGVVVALDSDQFGPGTPDAVLFLQRRRRRYEDGHAES